MTQYSQDIQRQHREELVVPPDATGDPSPVPTEIWRVHAVSRIQRPGNRRWGTVAFLIDGCPEGPTCFVSQVTSWPQFQQWNIQAFCLLLRLDEPASAGGFGVNADLTPELPKVPPFFRNSKKFFI